MATNKTQQNMFLLWLQLMDIRQRCHNGPNGFARIFLRRHYGTTTQTSARYQRHRSQRLPLFGDWPPLKSLLETSDQYTSSPDAVQKQNEN